MKRILVCLVVVLALVNVLTIAASAQPDERQRSVEQNLLPAVVIEGRAMPRYTIYERMQRFGVPGASVAVFRDGQFDWAEGYGVLRAGGSDSVHTSTRFQAASISKPVAATGALRLVEDGRLELDEDVNDYLRSWTVPDNEFTTEQHVTLRQLLSHTGGLTVHGFPGYARDETIPSTIEVLEGTGNTAAVVVDTIPGSIWRYSGGGYTVAQLVVSEVTDTSFAEYMREAVLLPLGMYESTFEQPLLANLADDAAAGHGWDGSLIPGDWHAYPEQAAAGLWTTPTDLMRFALAVAEAYRGESVAFLSQELAKQMLTPVVSDDYGLGFGVIGEGDEFRFGHGGANAGYRCIFAMYPGTGDGVVVMTNSDSGADLSSEILRAVSDVYGWPLARPDTIARASVDASILRRYAGTYEVQPGFTITIRPGDDRLHVESTRRHPPDIFPESETIFFGTDIHMRIRFDLDDSGAVTGLTILRGENEIAARKLK